MVERERRVISDAFRLGAAKFSLQNEQSEILGIELFCLPCHSDATMALSELGSSVAIEEILLVDG